MSVHSQEHMPVLQRMVLTGSSTGSDDVEEQCTSSQQNSYNKLPILVKEVSQEQLMSVLGTLTEAPWIKCEQTELMAFGEQSEDYNSQPDGEVDTKPSKEQLYSCLRMESPERQASRSKAIMNCQSTLGRTEATNLRLIKAFIEKNKITEAGKSQLAVAKPFVLLKQLSFVNRIARSNASGSKTNSADMSDNCVVGMPLVGERNASEEMVLLQDSIPLGCNSQSEPAVERNSQACVSSGVQNVSLSQEQHLSVFSCESSDNDTAVMVESTQIEPDSLEPGLGRDTPSAVEASVSHSGTLDACHKAAGGQTLSESPTRISDDWDTSKQLMLQNKETNSHDSIPRSVNETTQISENTSSYAFSENLQMSSSVIPQKHKQLMNRNLCSKACGKPVVVLEKCHGLALNENSGSPERFHPRQSTVQNSKEICTGFVLQNDSAVTMSGSIQNRHRRDVVCVFLNKFWKASDRRHEGRDAAAVANQHKICMFVTKKTTDRKSDERPELCLNESAEKSIMSESSKTIGGQTCPTADGVSERSVTKSIAIPVDGHSCCETDEAVCNMDQHVPAEKNLNQQEVDEHHQGMEVVSGCEDNESASVNLETHEVIAGNKQGRTDADRMNIGDYSTQVICKSSMQNVVCSDVSVHMPSEKRRIMQLNNSSDAYQMKSPYVDQNARDSTRSNAMGNKHSECLGGNHDSNSNDLEEATILNVSRKRRSRGRVKVVKRSRTYSPKKQEVSPHNNSLSPVSCHSPVRKQARRSQRLSLPKTNIISDGFCVASENMNKVKERSQVMSVASKERQRTPKKNLDVGCQRPGKCKSSVKQIKTVRKLPVPVVQKHMSLFEGTRESSNSSKPSVKLMPNVNTSHDPHRAVMEELCVVSRFPCIQKDIVTEVGHPKTVFQCSICPFTMKSSAEVMTHMSDKHSKDVHLAVCIGAEQTLPLHIGCRHCDFIAMNKLTLLNHFTTYHNVSGLKPCYITVTLDLDGGYAARVKYKCAACEFMANIRLDIEEHWFTRHLKRSLLLVCGQCSSFYTHSIGLLISHVKQHKALPLVTCTATVMEMNGKEVKEIANRKEQSF